MEFLGFFFLIILGIIHEDLHPPLSGKKKFASCAFFFFPQWFFVSFSSDTRLKWAFSAHAVYLRYVSQLLEDVFLSAAASGKKRKNAFGN